MIIGIHKKLNPYEERLLIKPSHLDAQFLWLIMNTR